MTDFIKLTDNVSVRRDQIASAELDSRHYMNGSSTQLVVQMIDGKRHFIEHRNYGYSPVDVFALKRQIEAS